MLCGKLKGFCVIPFLICLFENLWWDLIRKKILKKVIIQNTFIILFQGFEPSQLEKFNHFGTRSISDPNILWPKTFIRILTTKPQKNPTNVPNFQKPIKSKWHSQETISSSTPITTNKNCEIKNPKKKRRQTTEKSIPFIFNFDNFSSYDLLYLHSIFIFYFFESWTTLGIFKSIFRETF